MNEALAAGLEAATCRIFHTNSPFLISVPASLLMNILGHFILLNLVKSLTTPPPREDAWRGLNDPIQH